MPTVVVTDFNNVTIDGVPAGAVTDVLTNYGKVAGIRSDMIAGLRAWQKTRDDAHAAELEAARTAAAGAAKAHAAALADAQAENAKLRTYVEAVAGTDEAKRLAKEKRRADALAAKKAAEAVLAETDGITSGDVLSESPRVS